MTILAFTAIILFGFAVYNLSCAFADIPTGKTSRMMMLARKQQGVKNEKLLNVYLTRVAALFAPCLRLDKLKRGKLQAALNIAGLEMTPEVYTARGMGDCRSRCLMRAPPDVCHPAVRPYPCGAGGGAVVFHLLCSV